MLLVRANIISKAKVNVICIGSTIKVKGSSKVILKYRGTIFDSVSFLCVVLTAGCRTDTLPKGTYAHPDPTSYHDYYLVDTYVKYKCDDGYKASDLSRLRVRCRADGSWAGDPLICTKSASCESFYGTFL